MRSETDTPASERFGRQNLDRVMGQCVRTIGGFAAPDRNQNVRVNAGCGLDMIERRFVLSEKRAALAA